MREKNLKLSEMMMERDVCVRVWTKRERERERDTHGVRGDMHVCVCVCVTRRKTKD